MNHFCDHIHEGLDSELGRPHHKQQGEQARIAIVLFGQDCQRSSEDLVASVLIVILRSRKCPRYLGCQSSSSEYGFVRSHSAFSCSLVDRGPWGILTQLESMQVALTLPINLRPCTIHREVEKAKITAPTHSLRRPRACHPIMSESSCGTSLSYSHQTLS